MSTTNSREQVLQRLGAVRGGAARFAYYQDGKSRFALELSKGDEVEYLVCFGCSYICGKTSWNSVEITVRGRGEVVEVSDQAGGFLVECLDVFISDEC